MVITNHLYLPTLDCISATAEMGTGRSTPTLYMAFQHARFTRNLPLDKILWALTPHFHPHPAETGQLFSVALSQLILLSVLLLAGCAALSCPDFPYDFRHTIARLAVQQS